MRRDGDKTYDRRAVSRASRFYAAAYRRRRLWCLFSGALYSLAFLRGELFLFGFIGLFLLFLRLFKREENSFAPERPFNSALWFGFGFFVPLYTWLTALYPFETFGFTPAQGVFVVIAGVFGIGAFHALLLALPFLLIRFVPQRPLLLPLGAACCYMAGEWLMSIGTLAFPWGMAAVGQYRFLPLLQNASLFGARYITLIMCLFTASLALLVRLKSRGLVITACVSLMVPLITGAVLLAVPSAEGAEIKAAAVQGNELSMEKWDSLKLKENINKYISLTETAAQNGAGLIVLPETAFPCRFDDSIRSRVAAITSKYGCTVIVGALETENGCEYNALFAVYPDGTSGEMYYKRRLVPFGEFLPCRDLLMNVLPFLQSMNLSSLDLTAGTESVLIKYGEGAGICCFVCFDSVFPRLAEGDADLFCVATNDSWFKDTAGIYQHMAHSALRAVENGKWLIRAANTGVSCFISPKGVIAQATEPLTEAVIYGTVYTSDRRTLYSYVGDIIMLVPLCFIAFCAAQKTVSAVRKHKNKERNAQ